MLVARKSSSIVLGLIIAVVAVAGAKTKAAPTPVFPVIEGTTFTFAEAGTKENWTSKLTLAGTLAQYAPHQDTLNYFSKAGFRVEADGIYIVGETIADLGDPPPAAARAIAFPIKKGGVGKIGGFIPATYTVGARERVKVPAGTYEAWKITLTDKPNPPGHVWIAPGVGIVKIQLPSGRIDELVKITLPKS